MRIREGMTLYRLGRLGAIAVIALVTLGSGEKDPGEFVRVRLFSGRLVTAASLADAAGERLSVYDASGPLATLEEGQALAFDIWNEFLRAQWTSGSVPLERAFVKAESGTITVTVDDMSRSYRGTIEVILDGDVKRPGLIVINEVDLPNYVASVLPSEYGFSEAEGMKAQAVVIRTYALRALSQRQGLYDLTDDTGSQVYTGVSAENDQARAAVAATSGMAITYEGEPIEAVYSAHCGGHSANNEDVWNSKPVPYLRGRDDPYDKGAPVAHWESRLKRKDVHDLLSRLYRVKVKGVSISDRGSGDRVTVMRLDTDGDDLEITSQSFRVAVNNRFGASAIRSTLFDLKKDGDSYRFSGKGVGHGVGLCQWGAAEQARLGRSFKDILHFYYRDVKIEGYEAEPPVAAAAISRPAEIDEPSARLQHEAAEEPSPPPEKASTPRKRAASKGTSRKLTGRRVGW